MQSAVGSLEYRPGVGANDGDIVDLRPQRTGAGVLFELPIYGHYRNIHTEREYLWITIIIIIIVITVTI